MNPEQYEKLLDRLVEVRNTDDLIDLEHRLAPFDEDDPLTARALFQLACARCQLSSGPALSADRFSLTRPAPTQARLRFEVRGRAGTRIVRVGWADGTFFGSLYAIRLLESSGESFADAPAARQRIDEVFDTVADEVRKLAVA
jgi:hypothetical protein